MESYRYNVDAPVTDTADVLVIGGGAAGFPAAVAAARLGAKTLLAEQYGFLGGAAVNASVGPFMTSYDNKGGTQIVRGIFDELFVRMEQQGGAIHPSKVRAGTGYASYIERGHDHVAPFDGESLKRVSEAMAEQAGVRLLYHTQFLDVIPGGVGPRGALFCGKDGVRAILAKRIIDCTGDADVAIRAGVRTQMGDGEGRMQPTTLFFRIGQVDSSKVHEAIAQNRHLMRVENGMYLGAFSWKIAESRERGEWNIPRLSLGMYESVNPGEWRINTTRMPDVDGTSPEQVTRAEMEGRRQVLTVFNFMKANVPGCQNAVLLDSAPSLGVRETRHIEGEYRLTKDDVLNGRRFEDDIAVVSSAVDNHARNHPSSGEYQTMRSGDFYGIPYRVLVPREVNRLLVAGRCVSATSEAASAIRVMPPCMAMGQAAGTAAALSAAADTQPRDLDAALLRRTLLENGVYLGG